MHFSNTVGHFDAKSTNNANTWITKALDDYRLKFQKIIVFHLSAVKDEGGIIVTEQCNSAVSSPLDRSKCFTLSSPGRLVHSDTVLGFSWKHSSHAAIAQRHNHIHMSTTV